MTNKKETKWSLKNMISDIFSVKNNGAHKVVSVLGLKIKLTSPKRAEAAKFEELKNIINTLKNDNTNLQNKVINLTEQSNNMLLHLGTLVQQSEYIRVEVHDLNSQILDIRSEKFVNDNINYLHNPAKSKKRRLFLTTGNLSLLNNLTLIKQLDETDCEDILFVFSQFKNPVFDNTCRKMATLHNFEKIYIESNWNKIEYFANFFIDNKLFDVDEIYFSNQYQFIYVAQKLYPNTKWFLTDEGCAAFIAREYMDYNKIEKIYFNKYSEKLDFFGLSSENQSKVVYLNSEVFKQVTEQCAQMFPVDLGLNKDDKAILFCGMWWENAGIPQDEYFELQNSTIKKLQSMGYKVIFKPHPRDDRDYVSELGVTSIETSLPLECYDFDVVGTVSVLSSVTLQTYGRSGMPSFLILPESRLSLQNDSMWLNPMIKYMLTQYSPPIDILYSVNPKDYSKDELRHILEQKCADYINSMPLLSKNRDYIEYAKQCGYEFKTSEKEPVCV